MKKGPKKVRREREEKDDAFDGQEPVDIGDMGSAKWVKENSKFLSDLFSSFHLEKGDDLSTMLSMHPLSTSSSSSSVVSNSSLLSIQSTSSVNSSDHDSRRQHQIESEKYRRDLEKSYIEQLKNLLPSCKDQKLSKTSILHKAVTYIQQVERSKEKRSQQVLSLANQIGLQNELLQSQHTQIIQLQTQLQMFQQQFQQQQTLLMSYPSGNSNWDESSASLPPGWEETMTPEGKIFYINKVIGLTSWIDPRTNAALKNNLNSAQVNHNPPLNHSHNFHMDTESISTFHQGKSNFQTNSDSNHNSNPTPSSNHHLNSNIQNIQNQNFNPNLNPNIHPPPYTPPTMNLHHNVNPMHSPNHLNIAQPNNYLVNYINYLASTNVNLTKHCWDEDSSPTDLSSDSGSQQHQDGKSPNSKVNNNSPSNYFKDNASEWIDETDRINAYNSSEPTTSTTM